MKVSKFSNWLNWVFSWDLIVWLDSKDLVWLSKGEDFCYFNDMRSSSVHWDKMLGLIRKFIEDENIVPINGYYYLKPNSAKDYPRYQEFINEMKALWSDYNIVHIKKLNKNIENVLMK